MGMLGGLLESLRQAASGMRAQTTRLQVVSENVANADTPGYRRKTLSFETHGTEKGALPLVRAGRVRLDGSPLRKIHDPGHPLAGPDGSYFGSNVNLMIELADAREAQRSYEANLRMFDQARQMSAGLLELLRR
ncbi:flagellar basal-body rod protein FlgC [Meinhardsimonia xiamenensis]|jgi:flagellar basal-body rod protein FlgC|uniref:Flagellar basal-body rod protein FlgC n=1 Tax=Meinhardsimonia xiamenensis TaxID=990712 RepID=A0A1G9E9G0_9RHOB|nr:flagellar basal body rod protein FlgC [Meinhardsimonia xiamenensis]PRX33872.1 flagellar basal-body rod protein FlgC [Meinhardsimonia xiamenensis]SDK72734.1 flagellar basal-body rod protein FlgC [Meinhardsimonia xiamenensis]